MSNFITKVIAKTIKPEDLSELMFDNVPPKEKAVILDRMMGKMFSQVNSEDKMWLMERLLPKCIGMIFSELDSTERINTSTNMMQQILNMLENINRFATKANDCEVPDDQKALNNCC